MRQLFLYFRKCCVLPGKIHLPKETGGIKVHTLTRSDQDVPCMIRYSAPVANDSRFLNEIFLPKGSILVLTGDIAIIQRSTALPKKILPGLCKDAKNLLIKFYKTKKKDDDDQWG